MYPNDELIVCCVWTKGPKFAKGPQVSDGRYVFSLARAVARNLQGPYRFVVVRPKETTYWAKIALFKDGLFPPGARVLYLDLDSVIVGSLDFIRDLDVPSGTLYMVPSLSYIPRQWNSSALLWRADTLGYLSRDFRESDKFAFPAGDQQYLYKRAKALASFDRNLFLSYKRDIRPTEQIPPTARVIMFHGSPMPHEVNQPWVVSNWGPGWPPPSPVSGA